MTPPRVKDRPVWQERFYGAGDAEMFAGTTYEPGLNWLLETCDLIEDWGCGHCWAKQYVPEGRYRGVDGSEAAIRWADINCDLRDYRSRVDGVFMRHVLEHNQDWDLILRNALWSFRKRFVLVTFTPFSEETHPLDVNADGSTGALIDLSFRKEDITGHFGGFDWSEQHYEMPDSQYGVNDVFYVERRPEQAG